MRFWGFVLMFVGSLALAEEEGHNHGSESHSVPKKVRKAKGEAGNKESLTTVAPEQKSQFELEKGLLDTIYKGSLSETSVAPAQSFSSLVVTPHISFLSPQKLRLANDYFEVSHVDTLKAVPAFSLGVSAPMAAGSVFTLSYNGKVGYAFRESFTRVKSTSGLELVDQVKVHWLTLAAGLTADYQISAVPWMRPFVGLDAGIQWIYQGGKLDGLEQGFWIPFYQASAGLTLFSRPRVVSEWFGGIVVGASLRRSMGSQQEVHNWSADVGLSMYL